MIWCERGSKQRRNHCRRTALPPRDSTRNRIERGRVHLSGEGQPEDGSQAGNVESKEHRPAFLVFAQPEKEHGRTDSSLDVVQAAEPIRGTSAHVQTVINVQRKSSAAKKAKDFGLSYYASERHADAHTPDDGAPSFEAVGGGASAAETTREKTHVCWMT